jgi:hypothetical protein
LGFTLDVKPGEEIVGLLFVIGLKKEEGSYTYFIGIIIILHLRSRCKTPLLLLHLVIYICFGSSYHLLCVLQWVNPLGREIISY